ncbi:MAG: magnesium/cobalt transporter CorA [Nocardioidaceae bacterium]
MIVDCAVYHDGHRMPRIADEQPDAGLNLTAALEAVHGEHDFVWVGLHEPTDDEMNLVAKVFHLHPLAVEDAVQAHQRPKLERYKGEHLFMVLKTLWYVDEQDAVETGEIAIFISKSYIVTVRHGAGAELGVTRRELEEHREKLGHGPFAVLYSICDRVVDAYADVADSLEVDVDEVELSVFSDIRNSDAKRIYTLKREVAEFRRAVMPLREPLTRLALGQVIGIPESAAAFFRDVADHATRVNEQVESLDNLLSSAHDAHMARISVQQNDDMRKISAWVAMAAIPTMLAGIYGMNFTHMPELGWTFGYPAVVLVMLSACLLLYRLFKKAKWL